MCGRDVKEPSLLHVAHMPFPCSTAGSAWCNHYRVQEGVSNGVIPALAILGMDSVCNRPDSQHLQNQPQGPAATSLLSSNVVRPGAKKACRVKVGKACTGDIRLESPRPGVVGQHSVLN